MSDKHGLTERQIQACALYAQGLVIHQIAKRMNVSLGTVHRNLAAARTKMTARTMGELMFKLGREVSEL